MCMIQDKHGTLSPLLILYPKVKLIKALFVDEYHSMGISMIKRKKEKIFHLSLVTLRSTKFHVTKVLLT